MAAEQRTKKVNGQPAKQILLIHANLLNSYCLADILELYKKNGYKFISLADALKGNTAQIVSETGEAGPIKDTEAQGAQQVKPSEAPIQTEEISH